MLRNAQIWHVVSITSIVMAVGPRVREYRVCKRLEAGVSATCSSLAISSVPDKPEGLASMSVQREHGQQTQRTITHAALACCPDSFAGVELEAGEAI